MFEHIHSLDYRRAEMKALCTISASDIVTARVQRTSNKGTFPYTSKVSVFFEKKTTNTIKLLPKRMVSEFCV